MYRLNFIHYTVEDKRKLVVHPRFICWDCRGKNGCQAIKDDTVFLRCDCCGALNDLSNSCLPAQKPLDEYDEDK